MSSNWKEKLKELSKAKRISARMLAQRAGVSTSTIHDMLSKPGFAPQINTLEKVFEVLGTTIHFGHDYMTMKQLLVLLTEKSWGAEVTAIQAGQILDLIKTANERPLLNKLLSASSYEAFSNLLEAFS